MLEDHVAPELDPVPARARELVDCAQELEVDAVLPAREAGCLRAPEADVEGLVEADVQGAAREARQELVVETRRGTRGSRDPSGTG